MKKVLLHIILFILAFPAISQAQHVPDVQFQYFLRANFDAVLDQNNNLILDKARLVQEMDCSNQGISNLEGIQHFKGLSYLNCSGNNLTRIPSLIAYTNLQELKCSRNQLDSLPVLPQNATLRKIHADNNKLTSLPELLGLLLLEELLVNNNQLQSLPSLIANRDLVKLYVYENKLRSIPDLSYNIALQELICHNNQLTSFPSISLNTKLVHFDCGGNQISELPVLITNTKLQSLSCFSNKLTQLPSLSHLTQLGYLFCFDNQLKELPSFNGLDSLTLVICSKNLLTELPTMEGCTSLYALEADSNKLKDVSTLSSLTGLSSLVLSDNQLEWFPTLHNTFFTLDIRNNYLTFEDLMPFGGAGSTNEFQVFPQKSIPLGDPLQLKEGETKIFELPFDRQVEANRYYWSDNGVPMEGTTIDGSITLNKAMKLSVMIKNEQFPNDSIVTETLQVFVNSCVNKNCDEFVLSPNGDGEGDDYYCDVTGTIEIMNREGRIVKTLQGPAKWSGEDHPTGYFLIFVDGKRIAALTLVR